MFKIKVFDNIAPHLLKELTHLGYEVGPAIEKPDALLVRSHQLHDFDFPDSVKVVGRAGIGVDNIPIAALTNKGIPVLNTPGANANAVKELVFAGMLLACRHLCDAWNFLRLLESDKNEFTKKFEKEKKQFAGTELNQKTLGVIGLGHVGVQVANTALSFGMSVIGYDPHMTVKNALALSSNVQITEDVDSLLKKSNFISLHIPFMAETKSFMNAKRLALLKPDATLLNFSRSEIIDFSALEQSLNEHPKRLYVTDFPLFELKTHPQVIGFPHLGASTQESEENCARMIIQSIRDYLEQGHIKHSVNFPEVHMAMNNHFRTIIINENIPGMVAKISQTLAEAKLNIENMVNKSREKIAYTVIETTHKLEQALLKELMTVNGVINVRIVS